MEDWRAWYTLVTVVVAVTALVRGFPPDATLMGAVMALAAAGIITATEVFAGFSNQGMLTVAALFVVTAGLSETGVLDRLSRVLLSRARTERGVLWIIAGPVTLLSAFLNNTAVVAMMVGVVSDWCHKHRISPSRLLLPLSYLTILGGMCTLIGTSTNLVVSGLMTAAEQTPPDQQGLTVSQAARLGEMGLFELTVVGAPLAVLGLLYLGFIGNRLLPDRKDLLEQFGESMREYLVNMRVEEGSALVGQSVEAAGLRRLPGLFLVEISRDGRIIAPVEPDETLQAGDELTFTGAVSTIVDLERIPGFTPITDDADDVRGAARRYCEAVVSSSSAVVERTIRDANFRARYNAAVIAVHRNGERLKGRVGDIVLRPGDTLLLQTGPNFVAAYRHDPSFFLVSGMNDQRPVRHDKAAIAITLLLALIVLITTEVLSTAVAAFLVAGLMILTRCISTVDARRSVAWEILITIGASFAIATAIEGTGLATALAGGLVHFTSTLGPWAPLATLAGIYLLTSVTTEMITNNAAAVLIFPFALASAAALEANPRPFAIAIAVAASASFASPIGYQTNMMVYGPGGYRFTDFVKVGLPMNALAFVVAMTVIPRVWPLEL